MLSVCPSVRLIQGSSSQVLKGSYLLEFANRLTESVIPDTVILTTGKKDRTTEEKKDQSQRTRGLEG